MSDRLLSDWIESWKAFREAIGEAPFIYNEWVAVSIIAAVMQRKTWLPWEKRIYPNFYIALIGPAGVRKGEAMGPGNRMLRQLGIIISAEATTREALIRHLKLIGKDKSGPGFIDEDGIYKQYSALTVYSEEFTTFTRYDNRDLMADLANWWDCPDVWTYDTKTGGKDEISGVFFNLIGGTTPDLFRRSLPEDLVGGGLLSRIICVFQSVPGQIVIFPTEGDVKLWDALYSDLLEISKITGPFSYNVDFQALYQEWYPKQHEQVRVNSDKLAAYVARRSTHLRKLCMIMNASRCGDRIINGEDFTRALDLLERTEKTMDKTFEGMGANPLAIIAHRILNEIAMRGSILQSAIMKKYQDDLNIEDLNKIILTLISSKQIKKEALYDEHKNILTTDCLLTFRKE